MFFWGLQYPFAPLISFTSAMSEATLQGCNWDLPSQIHLRHQSRLSDHNEICLIWFISLAGPFVFLGWFRFGGQTFIPRSWVQPSRCWQRMWREGSAHSLILASWRPTVRCGFSDGILRRRREKAGPLTIILSLAKVGLPWTTHHCPTWKCTNTRPFRYFQGKHRGACSWK